LSNQKSEFLNIFEGLGVENFGIFYGHLVYFPVLVCCTKKNLANLVGFVNQFGPEFSAEIFSIKNRPVAWCSGRRLRQQNRRTQV
jgi:hypothetical protein